MTKQLGYLIAAAAFLAVGAYAYLALRTDAANSSEQQRTANAESSELSGLSPAQQRDLRQRILNTVHERGMVESAVTTEIRSLVVGSTKIISVAKGGSRIKKGDVVVELDSSALKEKQLQQQIVVTQAQASLMQANTKVEAVKSQGAAEKLAAGKALEIANLAQKNWLTKGGEYEIRLQTARSEVAIAELQEQVAQAVLDRKKKAGDTNLDEAKLALAQAREARRPTLARYRLLTGYQRDFESAVRELAVLKRQTDLLSLKYKTQSNLIAALANLSSSKTTQQIERSRFAGIVRQIERCKIRSPQDGMVIIALEQSRRSEPVKIEPGALVRESQLILQIADFSKLQVRVKVHDSRIGRVRKGQSATVRIDAFPGRRFRGSVTQIARTAEKGSWPNYDERYFIVLVSIEKPTAGIKPGMNVLAEIDVSSIKPR